MPEEIKQGVLIVGGLAFSAMVVILGIRILAGVLRPLTGTGWEKPLVYGGGATIGALAVLAYFAGGPIINGAGDVLRGAVESASQ